MDEIIDIAEKAAASVATRGQRGPLGFTTCANGGANDCKSLCPECFRAGFRLPDETVRETLRYWGTSEAEIEKFVAKVQRR